MLTAPGPAGIHHLLRRTLGPAWDFISDGDHLEVRHRDHGTPYRPPRRLLPWAELLSVLEDAFAEQGVLRVPVLPLRWGRETELTISAIQAMDPVLKDGRTTPYRQGFIPQPVVRLTAERLPTGALADGFLTSFVNTSRVELIPDVKAYATAFDELLTVLSRLGLHARHVSFHGRLAVWRRRQVEGVSLHFHHADMPVGDLVLLWNIDRPDRLILDLGTSLERLAWARSRTSWCELIFGRLATAAPFDVLDTLRTATLLIGNGIDPTARGAGSITRRLLRQMPTGTVIPSMCRVVRENLLFWNLMQPAQRCWPDVATIMEREHARATGAAASPRSSAMPVPSTTPPAAAR
ncbi:hypothetical protein ACIQGZ_25840 [Streptomyces sp. NPDC092296]|uniref:hypothetical protein n=1 Tax=Streptomyces sp. NPDC092296 TaxID=3366012 RepID=UPI00382158B3